MYIAHQMQQTMESSPTVQNSSTDHHTFDETAAPSHLAELTGTASSTSSTVDDGTCTSITIIQNGQLHSWS
jgi:hypothetical protein